MLNSGLFYSKYINWNNHSATSECLDKEMMRWFHLKP